MKPPMVRLSAVLLALFAVAGAGCGRGDHVAARAAGATAGGALPVVASQSARDAERIQDLVPLTTAQAADAARRVVLVTSRGSRVVEGAPGTPFTRSTFVVQEVLKGDLPHEFTIQVIGGRIGATSVTSLVPPFERSRRYILFLGRDNAVGPTIFPQSVLAVKRAGTVDVVTPAPSGIRLLRAGSSAPAHPLDAGPRLADVLFSIRHHLRTRWGHR